MACHACRLKCKAKDLRPFLKHLSAIIHVEVTADTKSLRSKMFLQSQTRQASGCSRSVHGAGSFDSSGDTRGVRGESGIRRIPKDPEGASRELAAIESGTPNCESGTHKGPVRNRGGDETGTPATQKHDMTHTTRPSRPDQHDQTKPTGPTRPKRQKRPPLPTRPKRPTRPTRPRGTTHPADQPTSLSAGQPIMSR